MIGISERYVRGVILERCARAGDQQMAATVQSLADEFAWRYKDICSLLVAMRAEGHIELSIWHAPTETGVPYAEWPEWHEGEFFELGVHDEGRVRISLPPPRPEALCMRH